MAADNWPAVLAETLRHEGGFVNHPADPGGATNLGITRATLSDWLGREASVAEVRSLTVEQAAAIYRARYWNPLRGDDLPAGLDLVAFDAGVNSGIRRGARWLQKAVGAVADGVIGPRTVAAARAAGQDAIERACAARMSFLRGLGTWKVFGRGWSRRVAEVEAAATRMWLERQPGDPGRELARQADRAEAKAAAEGAGAGAAGAVGGGAALGGELAGVPVGVLAVTAIIVAAIVIGLILRARHDRERALAYRKEVRNHDR